MDTQRKNNYIAPETTIVITDLHTPLLGASVDGTQVIGNGGKASASGVTSADAKERDSWNDGLW